MSYIIVNILLVFALCACSKSVDTYTVTKGSVTFTVDTVNGTIFDGVHTYEYDFSGDASSYSVKITYPNGASYYWDFSGQFGHGGWSGDYDEERYADGDTLCDVIVVGAPEPPKSGESIFFALVLIAVGAFNAAAPETAWYLEYGWRFKGAEPSDMALSLGRGVGVAALIAGLIMLFF